MFICHSQVSQEGAQDELGGHRGHADGRGGGKVARDGAPHVVPGMISIKFWSEMPSFKE